jgi:cobyrinic acid a,c-diamide synthase
MGALHKKDSRPDFLLAATHSGAGKTTITIGLLAALHRKGLAVQPFKCGPDFIDPTLHQLVTGKVSRNLDIRMCGRSFVRNCFQKFSSQADIAVIEGVMGLFDGADGSGATLAKELGLPVVLIVDTRSCAESIAAIVKGFETLDPDLQLTGIILNRVGSERHLALLRNSIEANCQTPVLGALPRNESFTIPDRHLGLMMGTEQPLDEAQIDMLAQTLTDNIDLDKLISLCQKPENIPAPSTLADAPRRKIIRIGIAQDEAFCFYYQDNFDILESLGAELVFFSPLHDQQLPPNIDGLYLGGGYPELYANELSQNTAMLSAVKSWSAAKRPLYAECGGFMYLTRGIFDLQNNFQPLSGIFPVASRMQARLAKLGYRIVTTSGDKSLFGSRKTLHGHEFHYSTIEEMPSEITRTFTFDNGTREGYQINNTLGTYLHQHFGADRRIAENFINFCQDPKDY